MKKILSAVLAAVMVFSLCAINVFATEPITFTANQVTAERGDEVTITVDISNNTGINGADIVFKFDKANIEAVSIKAPRDAFYDAEEDKNILFFTEGNVVEANSTGTWTSPFAGTNASDYNGRIVEAKFKVKDTAAFGTYTITLTCVAYDATSRIDGVVNVNGKITVACSNHTPGEWEPGEAADCTNGGTEIKKCTECRATVDTRDVNPTGHDWNEGVVTDEPTCDQKGVKTYTCKNDPTHTYTEEIPVREHAEVKVPGMCVPPTCTEDGYDYYGCAYTNCHNYSRKEVIPATGHDWGTWTEKTPAGCETPGEEERVCANDSTHVDTRPIDPTGHDWGEWTEKTPAKCEDDGEEERVCNNDPNHVDTRPITAPGHDWGDWSVTTDPSLTVPGEATRVCNTDATHVDTKPLPVNVLVITDSETGVSIELEDESDAGFSAGAGVAVMTWDELIAELEGNGVGNIDEIKEALDGYRDLIKDDAGNPVFTEYYIQIINDEFGNVGYGDTTQDAKFILTIPMTDDLKSAEGLKAYIPDPDANANDPAFVEIEFEVDGDNIVIDATGILEVDNNGIVSIPYVAFAGKIPSPGTGVEFYVGVVALLAVSAAAAFVFARKRA